MILNNVIGTAVRVSTIHSMHKIVYSPDSSSVAYKIETRYIHNTSTVDYTYGTDKDARDKDFERLTRAMDALDGIQQ